MKMMKKKRHPPNMEKKKVIFRVNYAINLSIFNNFPIIRLSVNYNLKLKTKLIKQPLSRVKHVQE